MKEREADEQERGACGTKTRVKAKGCLGGPNAVEEWIRLCEPSPD